ncbi:hypothetical protein [Novipirellula artificiosorum]|uniref:Uncharacterized protein n=1 Tax=Novipirellula artificiosorum TaxID=2528016 RepID=A0A5C6CTJ5_9BACT|nr:hypothetical protein [Novipirellula artificiosorum]TWU27920.1 hypothetical protein Poly41_70390 [Novipirellula artificiosorum]
MANEPPYGLQLQRVSFAAGVAGAMFPSKPVFTPMVITNNLPDFFVIAIVT